MEIYKATKKYVDVPAMYEIPLTRDEDGYLSIDYKMSEKDYASYKEMQGAMMEMMQLGAPIAANCLACVDCSINKLMLQPVYQDEDRCRAILYPSPSDSNRTFASSGMFPLVFYNVLKFFGKSETLENLARIANYGCWQHDNGTWWHYLDVMSKAYGLEVARTANLMTMVRCMNEGSITPVLLDSSLHPNGKGNLLAIPTEIRDGQVELYSPSFKGKFKHIGVATFTKKLKMVWVIENKTKSN